MVRATEEETERGVKKGVKMSFEYDDFVTECEYIFETPEELIRQLRMGMGELLEVLLPSYRDDISELLFYNREQFEEMREFFDEYE